MDRVLRGDCGSGERGGGETTQQNLRHQAHENEPPGMMNRERRR
jgi:hypothetical protein